MLIGIEGFPGSGKSTLMAWMALQDLKRGRPIACNKPMRGALHVPNFYDLMDFATETPNATLYVEEAGVFFRKKTLTDEILDMAAQARHRGLDIVLNYQNRIQLDSEIYRLQQVIYECKKLFAGVPNPWGPGYLAAPIFRFIARDPGTGEAMWGNTSLLDWRIWRPETTIYERVMVGRSRHNEAQMKRARRDFEAVVNDEVNTANLR